MDNETLQEVFPATIKMLGLEKQFLSSLQEIMDSEE